MKLEIKDKQVKMPEMWEMDYFLKVTVFVS